MFNTRMVLQFVIIPFILGLSDDEEWKNFKAVYKKQYENLEEETWRFKIFQDNLKKIESHNTKFEKGKSSAKLAINKFADVSQDEFTKYLNLFEQNVVEKPTSNDRKVVVKDGTVLSVKNSKIRKNKDDDDYPATKDWRDLGAVTYVKDETRYYNGFGWAFSVTGALETQLFETIGTLIPLSAQNLIDCANSSIPGDYGILDFAYNYIGDEGVYTEDEYPYSGGKSECQDLGGRNVYVGLYVDMSEESDIIESVAVDGTVVAVIDASRLGSYDSGIVDGSMCSNDWNDLNHSVLIVGYGAENGQDYWIVKNSWGIDWGEGGYFRIARMANNTCGIGSSSSLPIIVHDLI